MSERSAAKRARNAAKPTAKRAAARPVAITDEAHREAAVLPKMAAITIITLTLFLGSAPLLALEPSLDVSQYGHTAWTARNGFSLGAIFAMAQTPDGYLWLGSEFGLFRFDGVQAVPWQPPAGQQLPDKPYALLVTRDGTLWIGTFAGLVSWNGRTLTRYPEIGDQFVTSLLEDRDGTVWAGILGHTSDPPAGQLCAIRSGSAQCDLQSGAFGTFVWSLFEDGSGTLWAGAESGVWRWKPGPPRRYEMPGMRIGDLTRTDDGHVLIGVSGGGLLQFAGDKLDSYPIRAASNRDRLIPDRNVDSNKLLRDRDGGLWIGTHERGLIHIHDGRTDVFTKSDGLAGDISCSLFEDREGNIWVATTGGLDRFRQLPVTTISAKQGLSSDATRSVLATTDGSIWVAAHDGMTRWKSGQATIFRKASGLPGDMTQSLFQDDRGRIWVFTDGGLAYLNDDRFVGVPGVPSKEVFSMTGDTAGGLWLSTNKSLLHMRDGHVVANFPWPTMGRHQQAKVVVPDQGGVWLAFWIGGGVLYFEDGKVRASYKSADGLGEGPVAGLQLDRDGALWVATQAGGLSRIKDGRVATLTTTNGLPCDTIHWSMEDDDRSLWLYAACGLVRITRTELDAWIADPKRRIETAVWDAADGVRLRAASPAYYNPPVAKSPDGRLWFQSGEGVHVVDPLHLPFNKIPPPVHIEQVFADGRLYWQHLPGETASNTHLPPLTRDLQIDYVGLSFVAPERMQFRVKLEGQDNDWRVPVNPRHSHYTNLRPGKYTFRVKASNNSGVWNEQGDSLELSVAPAYYQTNWFRALCVAAFMALPWAAHRIRLRQAHHQFEMTLEARVGERTRIARELHDTLLQGAHGVLLRFQTVSELLPERPTEAKARLDRAIEQTADFITEARDEVQGLRDSTIQTNDLALAINSLGEGLASESAKHGPVTFHVAVEGKSRDLHPVVRDEIYKTAAEALRNAFRHAKARVIEVELRYDNEQFRLRVRDDGRGIDRAVLSGQGSEGHYGLPGLRERAALIGGKLEVWSEVDSGTEVELRVPASTAYATARRSSWWSRNLARKAKA
jgi:signal transduction histidine kinase/ligand-binding sensor domain-containing protein